MQSVYASRIVDADGLRVLRDVIVQRIGTRSAADSSDSGGAKNSAPSHSDEALYLAVWAVSELTGIESAGREWLRLGAGSVVSESGGGGASADPCLLLLEGESKSDDAVGFCPRQEVACSDNALTFRCYQIWVLSVKIAGQLAVANSDFRCRSS